LPIARSAKAAQFSSGEKQTATAAPDESDEAGAARESARVSDKATRNTHLF
jgi:hypothetical protein